MNGNQYYDSCLYMYVAKGFWQEFHENTSHNDSNQLTNKMSLLISTTNSSRGSH